MRFRNSFLADPGKGPEQLQEFIKEREKNKGPLYQTNSVKIFMDGVIEGSTGYLSEPYEHIDSHGELVWRPDSYKQMAAAIDKSGFQVHVHSIGDAATSIALDGLEAVQKQRQTRLPPSHHPSPACQAGGYQPLQGSGSDRSSSAVLVL